MFLYNIGMAAEFDDLVAHSPHGVFMQRFQQDEMTHVLLTRILFSPESTAYIKSLVFDQHPGAETAEAAGRINMNVVRIVKFHIQLRTGELPILSLVPTGDTFATPHINLLKGSPQHVTRMLAEYNIMHMLVKKALIELYVGGLLTEDYVSAVTVTKYITMDAYYNRTMDQQGVWHRDLSTYDRDVSHVSLEYFIQDDASIYRGAEANNSTSTLVLGPELLYSEIPIGIDRISDLVVRGEVLKQEDRRSKRVLVRNGTVIRFDNVHGIHSTPIVDPRVDSNGSPFQLFDDPGRLPPDHPVVVATRTGVRSFLRTWLMPAPPEPEDESPLFRHWYDTNVLDVRGMFTINPRGVEPRDLKGGLGPVYTLPDFNITYANLIPLYVNIDVPLQDVPPSKLEYYLKEEEKFLSFGKKGGTRKRKKRKSKKLKK